VRVKDQLKVTHKRREMLLVVGSAASMAEGTSPWALHLLWPRAPLASSPLAGLRKLLLQDPRHWARGIWESMERGCSRWCAGVGQWTLEQSTCLWPKWRESKQGGSLAEADIIGGTGCKGGSSRTVEERGWGNVTHNVRVIEVLHGRGSS
jgi:hypothetical protein